MGVDFLLENNGQRRYVDPESRSPRGQATITTNGIGQYVDPGYMPSHVVQSAASDYGRRSSFLPRRQVLTPLRVDFTDYVLQL